MASLLDVNVAIALLHAKHVHSARAVAWLQRQEEPGSVLICRVVQMGVLRILTNRAWLKDEALSAKEVWAGWDRAFDDDRFRRIGEPPDLEARWRRLTDEFPAGRSAETDTYLAAFAIAGGYRIVTFDRDFRHFTDLDLELLVP